MSIITLISSEDTHIEIPNYLALHSPLLKKLLTNESFLESEAGAVQLPFSHKTIKKIVEYFEYLEKKKGTDHLDNDFYIEDDDAIEMLEASDYLQL